MTERAELTLNEVVLLLRARNTNLSTRAANLLDAQTEVIERLQAENATLLGVEWPQLIDELRSALRGDEPCSS